MGWPKGKTRLELLGSQEKVDERNAKFHASIMKNNTDRVKKISISSIGKHNFKHTKEAKSKIGRATVEKQRGVSKIVLLGEEKYKTYIENYKQSMRKCVATRSINYRKAMEKKWELNPLERRIGTRHELWRKACLERDKYTCQHCGIKEEEIPKVGNTSDQHIHVHHIKPWRDYKELRFEVSNGLSLCPKCHRKEEHRLAISKGDSCHA